MRHPFNIPLFAPLLRERLVALAISSFALVQEGLVLAGLPGWPCPVLHLLGIPCPACGLSRGIGALARGDWSDMLAYHLFAPVFAIALVVIAISGLVSAQGRQILYEHSATIERRSGVTFWLLLAFVVYWVIRLTSDPSGFIRLMQQ